MNILTQLLTTEARANLSELVARWWRIEILVVTDTIVSFGPEHDARNLNEDYFGMSHLIGVLQQVGRVTRAHRSTDPLTAADVIPNFRFNEHDLNAYHQIWLLGYATGTLPDAEQAAIAKFMNAGGGVFATGDHAGLGSALAGSLPRVRSMRHWSLPSAPDATGPTRIDTTQADLNHVTVFENQSDDIPQTLSLKWYPWASSRFTREVYPHPLLCSPHGAITELPDHMHEGEVVVPAKLDARMNYIGAGVAAFDEYPPGPDGQRISPEIVAWGHSLGLADPEVMHGIHTGDTGPSAHRWSGTIGAYDGHRVGVGRVVVHSTWHHFFDINLIGDNAANRPGFNDPRAPLWRKGFTASVDGQRVLGQIDQYYRNIVHWLSPNAGLTARFEALVAQVVTHHAIREVIDGGKVSAEAVGAHAWEVALRYFPPCTVMLLTNVVLAEFRPFRVLPWDGPQPGPGPDDGPQPPWPVPPRHMAQAALGGAVLAFAQIGSIDALHDAQGRRRLHDGARGAVRELLRNELHRTREAHAVLTKAVDALGSDAQTLSASEAPR